MSAALACSSTQDFTTVSSRPEPATEPPPAGAVLPPSTPQAGETKPVVLATGVAQDDDMDPDRTGAQTLTTDATHVYWATPFGYVGRVSKAPGGTPQTFDAPYAIPFTLRAADGYVYYADFEQKRIMRMRVDGSAAPEALTPAGTDDVMTFSLDATAGRVAWLAGPGIFRCQSLPCTTAEALWKDTGAAPISVTMAGKNVFVPFLRYDPRTMQGNSGGISNVTGGGQVDTLYLVYDTVVAEPDPALEGAAVVDAASRYLLVQARWPGAAPARVLASGDDVDQYAGSLQLSGSYLYFLNRGARCTACGGTVRKGAIRRVKKDGSAPVETVWNGDDALTALVVDRDGLYVATNDGRVLRLPRPVDSALP